MRGRACPVSPLNRLRRTHAPVHLQEDHLLPHPQQHHPMQSQRLSTAAAPPTKTGAARCAPGTPPARACSCPPRPCEALTEKRPQGEAPVKTNRIIRRCKRKSCGHVWARQYETAPNTRAPFRIDESGKRVFASDSYEWTCPKCNSQCVTGNTVQGFISEHKCGAKCLSAIGPNCECSCGGTNHGTNWL